MSKEICNHGTQDKRYKISVNIDLNSVGQSKDELCESCRIKAEIELRDFINSSKYFKELSPFG